MIISSHNFVQLIKNNKRISEGLIPELIRRLIVESINNNTYIFFPSNDDIYTPGWDGIVKNNTTEHPFIPIGDIFFEIGTNSSYSKGLNKIKEDYEKRKKDNSIRNKNNYSYIAITTSILDSKKKQSLIDELNNEKVFKQLKILDANDLIDWMKNHINICIWFLNSYGEKIEDYGISLLSNEWERLSKCTDPNLNTDIFIVENESNSKKLIQDLTSSEENQILTVSSLYYGKDFSFAFCVASLIASQNEDIKNRTIIVNNQSGLNYVNAFCSGKIVLINFNCIDDRFSINLNNTYIFFTPISDANIQLNIVTYKSFREALCKLRYSIPDSIKISYIVDCNVLSLRRLLSISPLTKIPQWSRNPNKNDLIPLLLLGQINMENSADLELLRILIGENIDSYIETLNLWAEMEQSPILKYDSIYKICSRKECFEFIHIDMFSQKLKRIEEKLTNILLYSNKIIIDNSTENSIFDNNYIWSEELINNILDGFIILSEKNKKNQTNFDIFVNKVFDKIFENSESYWINSHYYPKLSELSPLSFTNFLRKMINNKINILYNPINNTANNSSKNLTYIFHSLKYAFENEKTALNGLECLLDLYYSDEQNNKDVIDKIIKILSPLATIIGAINIPFLDKIYFFFNYIEKKNNHDKTKIIMQRLYTSDEEMIMTGISISYRSNESKQYNVTYRDIAEMKNLVFNWMTNNDFDIIKQLKTILSSINNEQFNEIKNKLILLKEKIIKNNDEIKALACREILHTRENILKFNSWSHLTIFITLFDEILEAIKPNDDYLKYKYLLIDDDYPLLNPISTDEVNTFEKEKELRKQEKAKYLNELITKYGQDIIKTIIIDCKNHGLTICSLIYEKTDNYMKDIQIMIDIEANYELKEYLSCLKDKELKLVLQQYKNNSLFIQNLPFTQETYKWIDGNSNEKEYWENHFFENLNDDDFEYLFNKFLKYDPRKLIFVCTHYIDLNYEYCIKLLDTIANILKSNKTYFSSNDIYWIQELVEKLDNKYYTNDLSLYEFKLLSILINNMRDYPMGVKKYFWDNPKELGKFLIELYSNNLSSKSVGDSFLLEISISISDKCFIPKDYIIQKRKHLSSWVKEVLSASINKNKEERLFLKNAIIYILSACPMTNNTNFWPIKEVADILEDISLSDFDDKYDVSEMFSNKYLNRKGLCTISDGSAKLLLSNEFKKYQSYYQFTHAIISKALENISNAFNFEAEEERKRACLRK